MKIPSLKFKSILILFILGFSFGSCSSDDDAVKENIGNQELLLGKWLVSESSGQENLSDCEKTSFINYRADGIAESIIYTDTTDGECVPFIGGELNYELISDTKIKFTDEEDGDSFICEIISISPTAMKLKGFLDVDGVLTFKK